jgi:hypothetical protein
MRSTDALQPNRSLKRTDSVAIWENAAFQPRELSQCDDDIPPGDDVRGDTAQEFPFSPPVCHAVGESLAGKSTLAAGFGA